jgi:two-component system, OmpR family, alkaline phosphatase synthesis response regulator PhoP
VMMGEMSGFKMARVLRDNPLTAHIPIIFLTAKSTENDRLTGFALGADDFILKPFYFREVLARVKAVIRRVEGLKLPVAEIVSYDNLEISLSNKKVMLDKVELMFTKKEFEMLRLFLENKNRVFTREEILERVWTEEVYVQDRTIDVNINRLRKKIGHYGKNIVTRLGYGYCFEGQ